MLRPAVAMGSADTCATRTDGSAWCWGNNGYGETGDGTTTYHASPLRIDTATTWARAASPSMLRAAWR